MLINPSMLTVKQSQIKQYRNLTRVIDVSDVSIDTAIKFLGGCSLVCISRGTDHTVNGFYMFEPMSHKHVVCIGKRAHTILNGYSFRELIDLY